MSDANTTQPATARPRKRRASSAGPTPATPADPNSIQAASTNATKKAQANSHGLDLAGISQAPELERAGLLWDRAVRKNRSYLAQNERTKTELLGSQICAVFTAGRDQRDTSEFARDLADLTFQYARTNDPWRDRVVAAFGIDPAGPSGHSVRQYTQALKGLEIAVREAEAAKQALRAAERKSLRKRLGSPAAAARNRSAA